MSLRLYSLELKGNSKRWSIHSWAEPSWVDDWRKDGLEVHEILNIIPEWWVRWGLSVRTWCIFQDLVQFRNPWRNK